MQSWPNWGTIPAFACVLTKILIKHLLNTDLEHNGERAWKDIGDRLQAPYYLSRVDNSWKIKARKIRTYVGKFSFGNRTIADWNQLPEGVIGTSPLKRVFLEKGLESKNQWGEVKWIYVKWGEVKLSEVKLSEVRWSEVIVDRGLG
jgi:hypothetical protein